VLGDPGSFYLRRRGYGPSPGVNRALDQISAEYGIRRVEGWYVGSIGEYCEVYELAPGQAMADVLERLAMDARIAVAQAMNTFETQGVVYDDPLASMQPALTTLAIESAHELATGRGVTVAVVDSSVDARHRELRRRVTAQQNLVDGGGGRRAEVHGTAVAGVIGSASNNGEGIVGIAPDANIASLRACRTVDEATGRAQCSSFSLAQALDAAIGMRADVVNLSLSGPPDLLLGRLIDEAMTRGAIVVTAVAPHGAGAHSFPASHPGVIAAESFEHAPSPPADRALRAPGAEVMSTAPNNSYAFFSGNSMSAAYVAGISALVRERYPLLQSDEVLELLIATGSNGTVNACRAIASPDQAALCPADSRPEP
jgi:subtilisin family serine protease